MTQKNNEFLISIDNHIIVIIDTVETAVKNIRQGKLTEAYEIIAKITNQIDQLVKAIVGINDNLCESIEITSINGILAEMIESMQNEDSVLVGDLLEYELLELLSKWKEMIDKSM